MTSRLGLAALALLLCLQAAAPIDGAVYADQAGEVDWHKEHIGGPVSAMLSHPSLPKAVIVATQAGVVAALNDRTGETVWRQFLGVHDEAPRLFVSPRAGVIIVASQAGLRVQALDVASGRLVWEAMLAHALCDVQFLDDHTIAVLAGAQLEARDLRLGDVLHAIALAAPARLASEASGCLAAGAHRLVCVLVPHAELGGAPVLLAVATGGKLTAARLSLGAEPAAALGDASTHQYAVVPERGLAVRAPSGALALIDLVSSPAGALALVDVVSSAVGAPAGAGPCAALRPDLTARLSGVGGPLALLRWHAASSHLRAEATSRATLAGLALQAGEISCELAELELKAHGFVEFIGVLTHDTAPRMLVSFEDAHVAMVRLDRCALAWQRSEALAAVTSVARAPLPGEDARDLDLIHDALGVDSRVGASGGIPVLGQWLKRVSLQARWLADWAAELSLGEALAQARGLVFPLGARPAEARPLQPNTRDQFGFRQLLLLGTRGGRLVALHSGDGHEVYSRFFPRLVPGTMRLHLAASPRAVHDVVVVVGELTAAAGGGSFVAELDPASGITLQDYDTPRRLVSVWPLPPPTLAEAFADGVCRAPHAGPPVVGARPLVGVDDEGVAHVLGTTCPAAQALLRAKARAGSLTQYNVDAAAGVLRGASASLARDKTVRLVPSWSFSVGADERIVDVAERSHFDRLAAPSLVDAAGGVRFKYVSPNLVAVLSELRAGAPVLRSSGGMAGMPSEASEVHLYLVDVRTGAVLVHQSQPRASGPARVTMVEHRTAYTYWSVKAARFELVAVDLYEPDSPDHVLVGNATISSHTLVRPIVETQAFVLPLAVEAMGATMTTRGITARQFLLVTKHQGVLALDQALVDGRRSTDAALSDAAGLPRYDAQLPLHAGTTLSYSLALAGLRRVLSLPCDLESHALVLAYGLDMFGTRVAPSGNFDSLGPEFQYGLLLATTAGLVVASYVVAALYRRKAIAERWK